MKDLLAAGSHPQVVAGAKLEPMQRQEPRASSRSPLQVQGPKAQGRPLTAFTGHKLGAEMEVEEP